MFQIKLSPLALQFLLSIIVNVTYLHIGLSVATISPMVSKLMDVNQTTLQEPLTDSDASWVVSSSFLATGAALWFSSYLGNYLGRRKAIIILCVPRVIMALLLLFASRIWMLILARVFNGIADTVLPLSTAYASEIASTKIRGAICVISQIMAAVAVMFMFAVGPYVPFLTLQIINTSIITATTVPMFFIPESPYHLYSQGKQEECLKILTQLRESTTIAQEELEGYSLIRDVKINKKEIFNSIAPIKAMGIVFVLGVCSQAVGYNIIIPNLMSVFQMAETNVSPEFSSLISGCVQLLGSVCAVLATDKLGRKPLLIVSLIGFAVGWLCLGIFFKMSENGHEISGSMNYLPLISVMLVMFCNTIGIGCLAFPVMAELFEGPLRTLGVSMGQFLAMIVVFFGTKYFYSIVAGIGPAATYWMFCGFCILTCLFIVFCVPETKGKPFSQIQRELERKGMFRI